MLFSLLWTACTRTHKFMSLSTATITIKYYVESILDGQARSGRETKDGRGEVAGRSSREGINNISAQLILSPLSIKSFFHASIGIPVGHFAASLAGHFACNQNGTLSLWPIHCSPDSI